MTLDLTEEKGTPLDAQQFSLRELAGPTISTLHDDAFTRLRIIWMNRVEQEANRFSHSFARFNQDLRGTLAAVRRVEHHQQTMVNWLLPPDQSPLETTIGYEQAAIEVTAAVTEHEPVVLRADLSLWHAPGLRSSVSLHCVARPHAKQGGEPSPIPSCAANIRSGTKPVPHLAARHAGQ